MTIRHVFSVRDETLTDNSKIFVLETPGGERIASASTEEALKDLEMALNLAITDAVEANSDITVDA